VEYSGGEEHRQDIDVFVFYRHWASKIPLLNVVIVEILSTPLSQAVAEKVFSRGRFVLPDNRVSLKPERTEQLIVCVARHAISLTQGNLKVPKIVDIGVDFTVDDLIIFDAMIDEDAAIEGLVEEPDEADFDAF
jgi:hypothetical protein